MKAMTRLIDRDEEICALISVLNQAEDGSGAAGLVLGPAGNGKSALLDAVSARGRDMGFTVLRAAASENEQPHILGVAGQLFHNHPATSAELHQQAIRLTDEPTDPRLTPPVMYELTRPILDHTQKEPLLICVDDIHFADDMSIQWITFLLRRLAGHRVAVVLTELASHQQRIPAVRDTILRTTGCSQLLLTPLTHDGVARLLASRGLHTASMDTALTMALSGGNPLLVHALADDAHAEGDHRAGLDGSEPGTGYAFQRAVSSCLHQIGAAASTVARGRAVLGAEATDHQLAELLGLPPQDVLGVVRDLDSAGLLERGRFRHPAVQTSVLEGIPAAELGELHHRAARLLHKHGAGDREVIDHLLATGSPHADHSGPEDDWGPAFLCEAARKAVREGDWPLAQRYAEHALRLSSGRPWRGAVLALLVSVEWEFPTRGGMRHFAELAETFRSHQLDGPASAMAAKYLLRMGFAEATERGLETLPTAAEASDADAAADLQTVQARLSLSYPGINGKAGRLEVNARLGEAAGLPARVRANPTIQAAALLSKVLRGWADASTLRGAEQVLRSTRITQDSWEQAGFALVSLIYSERLPEAEQGIRRLLKEAEAIGATGWCGPLQALRAEVALRSGQLHSSERYAREALSRAFFQENGVTAAMPLATLVLTQTALGAYDAAADSLARPLPSELYQARHSLHYLHARGEFRLATQHTSAALEDFLICGDLMREWGMDLPGLVPWRISAAKAHLQEGRRRPARILIDEELRRLGSTPSRLRGMALRVSAAASDLRRRPAILRQAVDDLQGSGNPVELAQALTDLAQALREQGDHKKSRVMTSKAWQLAAESGAQPISAQLTGLVPDHGMEADASADASASAASMLSDAERRVAALAVIGHTNREIAKQLYITVSTVEQHLTRVYRKLRVTQRSELPAVLLSAAPVPQQCTRFASADARRRRAAGHGGRHALPPPTADTDTRPGRPNVWAPPARSPPPPASPCTSARAAAVPRPC